MKFVLVPPGEFMMGSDESPGELAWAFPGTKTEWFRSEQPQHQVRITRPFYLGVYEVTQGEYEGLMGRNPSFFSQRGGRHQVSGETRRLPVECVSWEDAKAFCDKLSRLEAEKKAGMTYCLPTEAQWEYACRAGANPPFFRGTVLNGTEANCDGPAPYGTEDKGPSLRCPTWVGSYAPNAFGLYDMHGNVWEWCQDWWHAKYYAKSPPEDPPGPATGSYRVIRGGGWISPASFSRAVDRYGNEPDFRIGLLGFRVAAVPPGE
jgi:formylglycine-generating enzyme required for sulfatase activity